MINSKISTSEAIMIIVSIISAHIILTIPNDFLKERQSGTIINIIYVSILAIIFAYIVYRLFKSFPSSDILDISEFLGGKILKNILGFLFISYFITTSAMFLRNFGESLKVIYYPMTNVSLIILFFIIAISIGNKLNFNATIKTNLIIIPIVLISILLLFFSNFKNFVPNKIFPLLGNGFVDTFVTGIGNIFAFSGIVFMYFMPPLLKEPEKFKKIAITSMIISSIYLLISVSTLLFIFSFFTSIEEIMPLYSAARYIEFGSFFQRLESVFILFWIISYACYLSILSKFSILIFKKIGNLKDYKPLVYPFSLLLFGISLLPENYAQSKLYASNYFPYIVIGLIFIIVPIVLILSNIKKKQKKEGELL